MKSLTRFLFVFALLALTGLPAEAGLRVSAPVSITQFSDGTGTAAGSMGSARNGAGSLQYIGTWAQLGFPVQPGSSVIDTGELSGGIVARNASGSLTVNCIFPISAVFSYLPQLALVNSDSSLMLGYEPTTNSGSNDRNPTRCNGLPNIPIYQCCNSLSVFSFSYNQPK